MDPQQFADAPAPQQPTPAFNTAPPQQPPAAQAGPAAMLDPARAQRLFNDPDAMLKIAQIYYKHGVPGGVEWLARGHEAAKNNVFEAFSALQAGDGEAAVAALQKSNRFKGITNATPNEDGTWMFSLANGQQQRVDPKVLMNSLLTPPQQVAAQQKDRELSTHEAAQRSLSRYQDVHGDALKSQAADREEQTRLRGERNDALLAGKQAQLSHAFEMAGVKADAARDLAEFKGSPTAFGKKLTEEMMKNIAPGDAGAVAQINATVDQLVRARYVDVHKNPDGDGFVLVDKMGGNGNFRALGVYPDMETAGAAKVAYVAGKNLPSPPGAAPAKPAASGTGSPGFVRRLLGPSTSTATVKDLDEGQLRNVIADQKASPDVRAQAQAELDRRKIPRTAPRNLPPDDSMPVL